MDGRLPLPSPGQLTTGGIWIRNGLGTGIIPFTTPFGRWSFHVFGWDWLEWLLWPAAFTGDLCRDALTGDRAVTTFSGETLEVLSREWPALLDGFDLGAVDCLEDGSTLIGVCPVLTGVPEFLLLLLVGVVGVVKTLFCIVDLEGVSKLKESGLFEAVCADPLWSLSAFSWSRWPTECSCLSLLLWDWRWRVSPPRCPAFLSCLWSVAAPLLLVRCRLLPLWLVVGWWDSRLGWSGRSPLCPLWDFDLEVEPEEDRRWSPGSFDSAAVPERWNFSNTPCLLPPDDCGTCCATVERLTEGGFCRCAPFGGCTADVLGFDGDLLSFLGGVGTGKCGRLSPADFAAGVIGWLVTPRRSLLSCAVGKSPNTLRVWSSERRLWKQNKTGYYTGYFKPLGRNFFRAYPKGEKRHKNEVSSWLAEEWSNNMIGLQGATRSRVVWRLNETYYSCCNFVMWNTPYCLYKGKYFSK